MSCLEAAGMEPNEESRQRWREFCYTNGLQPYCSAVVMEEEALNYTDDAARTLPQILSDQGVVPAMRVDQGFVPLNSFGEKGTEGIVLLQERCEDFYKSGVRIAKWRTQLECNLEMPTDVAVWENSDCIARAARICQANGLAFIAEVQTAQNTGSHSIERTAYVCEKVSTWGMAGRFSSHRWTQSAAGLPPDMPESMRRIMDDYERRRAEEDAHQSAFWRLANSSTGALLGAALAGAILWLFYCLDDVSSSPQGLWAVLFRKLGEESASQVLVKAARWRLLPRDLDKDDPYLMIEPHEGLKFYTPVGLGPGLDTCGEGLAAFFNLGFGFVEVGPVGAGGAKPEMVLQNLERRDVSQQIAQLGLLGASVGGSREELLSLMSLLGPKLQLFAVDLAALPANNRGEVAKIAKELVLAAMQLPGGGPRIFLRLPASWPDASASHEERCRAVAEVAEAARRSEASGLIICRVYCLNVLV
ncbi:aldo-2 [Symbiodinium natans]|uniref:fructose-bisphosphate aldolase n=1 Tax=Symbiodinium natans TaxID=878477 RepID=A0A812P0E9_9DINO|nr:aldo-2 [Symbiodinium natans]